MKDDNFINLDSKTLLRRFIVENKNSIQEAASLIGDDENRIARVLEGKETLGRTARLALVAVMSGLEPISSDE